MMLYYNEYEYMYIHSFIILYVILRTYVLSSFPEYELRDFIKFFLLKFSFFLRFNFKIKTSAKKQSLKEREFCLCLRKLRKNIYPSLIFVIERKNCEASLLFNSKHLGFLLYHCSSTLNLQECNIMYICKLKLK